MLKKRFHVDLVEWGLYTLMVMMASVAIYRYVTVEDPAAALRARFGDAHWSHGAEEWIVRAHFADRRGGVFLDVGSADPREGSNTYFLESALGWTGVAIDAQAEYADAYRTHRPNTQFYSFFVSDRSDDTAVLFVDRDRPGSSSSDRGFTETYSPDGDIEERHVPTITLNDLLPRAGIEAIDFVSMDIELAEPQALAGFDLPRYRPALVCVEQYRVTAQWLLDYFGTHGYTPVAEYLRIDPHNYWFAPIGARTR